MLNYINPNTAKPLDIVVFTRKGCPFCVCAKGLLRDQGIEFEELVLNRDYTGGSDHLEQWLGMSKAA